MSRTARLVEPGIALQVTARGNYQQDTFFGPEDRGVYLDLLARYAASEGLRILGWCLMTNHLHLLVVPELRDSLARAMKRTQSDYSGFINRRRMRRAGHLWQARFYSCPLDGDAVWTALRYIELNPVRAGIVAVAQSSNWSSAAFHCGEADAPSYLDLEAWGQCWSSERWSDVLALGEDERLAQSIREATQRGLPVGTPEFLDTFRQVSGRDFVIRPVGRPRLARPEPAG